MPNIGKNNEAFFVRYFINYLAPKQFTSDDIIQKMEKLINDLKEDKDQTQVVRYLSETCDTMKRMKISREKCEKYDYLLIEGAGGITCPLRLENGEKFLLKDLIKELNTSIVIIADGGLGTINSTLLTVEYAKMNNIEVKGIILNNFDSSSFMHQDNLKQVEYLTGIKVIATVAKNQKDIKLLKDIFS